MNTLTDYQKSFLLEYFFKNERFASWRNIATSLLEKGECVVAGTECIWHGGIGNFIKTETANGFVGCSLYKFDLKTFLTSEWYKQIKIQYISIIEAKKRDIVQECDEIASI